MKPQRSQVTYLVLCHGTDPFLLARVRWPDIAEAVSATFPDWRHDPGLFDLPYDPASTRITPARAAAIAAEWGAADPISEDIALASVPSMVRRMPPDWSHLAPAETRAWSLDLRAIRARARRRSKKLPGRLAALELEMASARTNGASPNGSNGSRPH